MENAGQADAAKARFMATSFVDEETGSFNAEAATTEAKRLAGMEGLSEGLRGVNTSITNPEEL
jgi:hypothetical protein